MEERVRLEDVLKTLGGRWSLMRVSYWDLACPILEMRWSEIRVSCMGREVDLGRFRMKMEFVEKLK